jgi:hypothetical protein
MADPIIIPLGSLADAAAASSQLAQDEQLSAAAPIDIGTTIGYIPPPPILSPDL